MKIKNKHPVGKALRNGIYIGSMLGLILWQFMSLGELLEQETILDRLLTEREQLMKPENTLGNRQWIASNLKMHIPFFLERMDITKTSLQPIEMRLEILGLDLRHKHLLLRAGSNLMALWQYGTFDGEHYITEKIGDMGSFIAEDKNEEFYIDPIMGTLLINALRFVEESDHDNVYPNETTIVLDRHNLLTMDLSIEAKKLGKDMLTKHNIPNWIENDVYTSNFHPSDHNIRLTKGIEKLDTQIATQRNSIQDQLLCCLWPLGIMLFVSFIMMSWFHVRMRQCAIFLLVCSMCMLLLFEILLPLFYIQLYLEEVNIQLMHYSNNPIKWKTNNIGIASLRKSLGSILIGVLDSTEKPLFFISGIIACCMTIGTTLLVLIVVLWRSLWPHSMYGWQYTLLKRFTLVDIIIVSMLLVSLESAFGLIQTRDTNALVHITPDTVRYLRSGIPLIMIGFIYMHLIKILVNIFLLHHWIRPTLDITKNIDKQIHHRGKG